MDIRVELHKREWSVYSFAMMISMQGVKMSEQRMRRILNGMLKDVKDDEVAAMAKLLQAKPEDVRAYIDARAKALREKIASQVALVGF